MDSYNALRIKADSDIKDPMIRDCVIKKWGIDSRIIYVTDPDENMSGVDMKVITPDNDVIRIEAKIREIFFDDILLELHHFNPTTNRQVGLGWARKQLDCDYLIYVWMDVRKGYLIPYKPLSEVISDNLDTWLEVCELRDGKTFRGGKIAWKTKNVAVPTSEILPMVPGVIPFSDSSQQTLF